MRRLAALAVLTVAGGLAPASDSYYLAPDVPSILGGASWEPRQIVRNDAGSYTHELTFPVDTVLDALHRRDDGHWLLSVAAPAFLGATTWQPEDVVRYDNAGVYSSYFDGSAQGVPSGSNVDAVFIAGDDLVLSFDVPTTIGGTTYAPADLVRYAPDGTYSHYLDASASSPPIPVASNVTGADTRLGEAILTFDVPTTLGADTFLPGELVAWDGLTFSSHYEDAFWPASTRANALAFLADPGKVAGLTVSKGATPDILVLSWSQGCPGGDEDHGIYRGQLGVPGSHTAIDCADDGGDLTEVVPNPAVASYFLVVPHNPNDEGSYGKDGLGFERPPGAATCVPTRVVDVCP